MYKERARRNSRGVAPFAGAWIEISAEYFCNDNCLWSLPSRGRGLKLYLLDRNVQTVKVAPFAGAWIEIGWLNCHASLNLSLPSRGRGLK